MFEKSEKKYNIKYVVNSAAIVSYPKSGRTWLRMMMAKIIKEMKYDTDLYEALPALHHTPAKLIRAIGTTKIKVVFLRRDEADVVVSSYAEKTTSTRSGQKYSDSISNFIRHPDFGITKALSFNKKWIEDTFFIEKHSLTYEDLKIDPFGEIRKICDFLDLKCSDDIIQSAVEYSSFDNMKKIDNGHPARQENLLKKYKGNFAKTPGRVRRGMVKGYLKDLNAEDIKYVEKQKRKFYDNS